MTSLPQSEKSPLSSWHWNVTFVASENVKLALVLLASGSLDASRSLAGVAAAAVAPARAEHR